MGEWLSGTKRRLYTISVLTVLGLSAAQVLRHGLDVNVTNLLIFTVGSTAAAYSSGRWAEAKENSASPK